MPSHFRIDATRTDLARQFKDNPLGPHSVELQRIVNRMRWDDVAGRYVLVTRIHHREWVLGQLSGKRGVDLTTMGGEVFTSRAQAEWAVFQRRWQALTCVVLELD